MANTLEYLLKIKDEATSEVLKFGKTLDKNTNQLKSFQMAAGVAGVAVTGFGIAGVMALKDWANAASEAENEMMKVDAILNNVQKSTSSHAGSLKYLQSEVEKTSQAFIKLGFDDEETALTMAKTIQITSDVAVAQKAMAAAADLASFKGISLTDASQALNMALDGNGKVLTQLGIVMKDHATQAEVIAAVNAKVGGTAEASSKSYAVQMQVLNIGMTNLKESLGAVILPEMTKFVELINGFVDAMNKEDPAKIQSFVTAFTAMTGAALIIGPMLTLVSIIPQLTESLSLLSVALSIPSAAIVGIIALIPILVGSLIYLALNFDILKENVRIVWDQIGIKTSATIDSMKKTIGGFFTYFTTTLASNWEEVKRQFSQFFNDAYNWGKNIIDQFAKGIREKGNAIANEIKAALDNAKKFIEGHSPPSTGPFKDIDKWGYNVGDAWVKGMREALDVNPFEGVTNNQKTYNQSMVVNANLNNQMDAYTLGNILARQWEVSR